ncbi:ATP-binding cassette domain-containing protein [Streptomyces ortus]|uniref:ATP-binding cassette domain-containing protein n=1 Tax=Streptomyces ortus TaxID=2867268 RepID=A0ABT3UZ04_9ACTN|nr:ATP-binding cassette domain-containing protein [Streptomyces ortus]MCX4232825.1 ATP-binding cassette domain-containing protein [Streptomyces ortus]
MADVRRPPPRAPRPTDDFRSAALAAFGSRTRGTAKRRPRHASSQHCNTRSHYAQLAPRRVHGTGRAEAEARARELLDRLGLGAKADEYPDRLSGGQQQRAAIVRALAVRPRLLLLDEVTAVLDPELVGEVLNVVRDLKEDGMTLVLATHEMGFARDVADQVCFLDGGVVLERGPAEEVLGEPREERTRRFLRRIVAAGRL